ncbi:Clp protease [Pseudidiomarina woesei]|uniref:Clp protease n=1 Tax=Pseudidiomarina woesei TaxID=1381080 RepID=A0A0K6H232_9GAMM|nr:Clp protease [Pseudidiomarina woesei]
MVFRVKTMRVSKLIKKHWQGDYSLGKAYWLIGVGLTCCLSLAAFALNSLLNQFAVAQSVYSALVICLYSFTAVFTIWQLVGIWRSAKYHTSNGGRQGWATAAQVMVIVAALRAVFDFNQFGLPMMQTNVGLMNASELTNQIELRVLNQGTEIELIGPLPYGTTESVQAILQRFPSVRVIHLNSPGGRISEGVKLYDLIQEYQLDTYVPSECSSACTIAFMGGQQRYLSKRGILGFHSASLHQLDGADVQQINDDFKRIYRQHGVSESFIRQSVRVDGANIWYPGPLELIEARVVNELVQSDRFAPSNATHNLATTWRAELLIQGPDAELVAYWRANVDIINYLNYVDAQFCVDYLYPQWAKKPVDVEALIPINLISSYRQAKTDLVERTQLRNSFRYQPGSANVMLEQVLSDVGRYDALYPSVFQQPSEYRAHARLLCQASIAVYEGALRLPTHERQAALLRFMQQR